MVSTAARSYGLLWDDHRSASSRCRDRRLPRRSGGVGDGDPHGPADGAVPRRLAGDVHRHHRHGAGGHLGRQLARRTCRGPLLGAADPRTHPDPRGLPHAYLADPGEPPRTANEGWRPCGDRRSRRFHGHSSRAGPERHDADRGQAAAQGPGGDRHDRRTAVGVRHHGSARGHLRHGLLPRHLGAHPSSSPVQGSC